MKAHYRTKSNRITFEVEGQSVKDLFRGIAEIQEVFEADDQCGHCESKNIQFRLRRNEGNEFYELACEDCNAALSYGQTKKGDTLFPKRKDASGTPLADRGWKVWRPASAATPPPAWAGMNQLK